jgi:hypothetical protein
MGVERRLSVDNKRGTLLPMTTEHASPTTLATWRDADGNRYEWPSAVTLTRDEFLALIDAYEIPCLIETLAVA